MASCFNFCFYNYEVKNMFHIFIAICIALVCNVLFIAFAHFSIWLDFLMFHKNSFCSKPISSL